jgi:lambda family phage portal protein
MRHGAVEERDNWQVLQQWMIDEFCRPVFERWLSVQLLAGTITINGKPLKVEREEKYRQVIWQARRWKWIDPLKDVKANIEAVNAGLRSRGSIIREGGDDPEDVWDEMEQENALLEKKGIHLQDSKLDQGAMNEASGNDAQN